MRGGTTLATGILPSIRHIVLLDAFKYYLMKSIFLKATGCILFYLIPVFFADGLKAQKTIQGLNDHLKAVQAGSKLQGFAVAIIKDDAVIFSGGYGFADKKKKTPFTIETVQPIGSVSKTFIGLALMQAIDKGYFTLETPINDLLPFKIINPWQPAAVIRIRDLATHTSSLLDDEVTYKKLYVQAKKPTMELKDFLKAYYTEGGVYYNKTNFSNTVPGRQYNYTNIGAALAAYIIELKANTSFDKFTATNIFLPLKMADTHWVYDEAKSNRYATLYQVNRQDDPVYKTLVNSDGTVKTYSNIVYPAVSLRSSVADLGKYLVAMIKGYTGKPGMLPKKSFETLFRKQFAADNMPANMDPRETNRALFWAYNRKGKISLTGHEVGLATFISFDPVTRIGRILLINTELEGIDNILTIEAFMNVTKSLDNFEQGK